MNSLLRAALRKIANDELDQVSMWRFKSTYGTVYMIMSRQPLGVEYDTSTEYMYEDLDGLES